MDYFMEEAFREALKAYSKNEVPIGAVIVIDDEIVSRGHNIIEKRTNALCHAELMAIEEATRKLKRWRLVDAKMYVTLEPCLMCTGAILNSRISELHIGALDKERGTILSKIPIVQDELIPNSLKVFVYNDETCKYILQRFFKKLRKR